MRLLGVAFVAAFVGLASGAGQAAGSPYGNWLTPAPQVSMIQLAACGTELCGKIIGTTLATANSPLPKDWQGQPVCGLTIIRAAPVAGSTPASWRGTIRDPRNGRLYNANISLDKAGHLRLRGYIGIALLGQTQIWRHYTGSIPADCRMVAAHP